MKDMKKHMLEYLHVGEGGLWREAVALGVLLSSSFGCSLTARSPFICHGTLGST